MRLLLASGSPRRADLLRAAGISFETVAVAVDESLLPDEAPEHAAARLAERKARSVAIPDSHDVILAADTIVAARGVALGKPADEADALRMLRMLSGRSHDVLTGICLRHQGRCLVHVESTEVRFLALSEAEMSWYVATGEFRDKAGGYAIQGLASRFVAEIHGSYSNVVGLPISSVYDLLKVLGCDILDLTTTP